MIRLIAMIAQVTCILVTLSVPLLAEADTEALSPKERVALFNGKDLTGLSTWLADTKREDPRGVFTVKDEQLRISGDGYGYLGTTKAWRDYHLTVEYRWGDRNWRDRIGKARDSGIFLHATGEDGNSYDGPPERPGVPGGGAYMAAIECNVMEGATGDFLLIKGKIEGKPFSPRVTAASKDKRDVDGWLTFDPQGKPQTLDNGGRVNWLHKDVGWRDVFGCRGEKDVESKPGEWTTVECICDGSRITIRVNGKLVNEVTDVRPAQGRILIQCEGSELFVRRFELKPLDQKGP